MKLKLGKKHLLLPFVLLGAVLLQSVHAGTGLITPETTLLQVAVTGGADTANPGITCIQLAAPPPACPAGFVYLPNNNKHLVAAALAAKAASSRVTVYYVAEAQAGHCPGHVFTPCSVISINVR
jgi:hypothetical protein